MSGSTKYEKLKIRVLSQKEEKEHFHQDIELLFVLEGTMKLMVGDKSVQLAADDIIVINANERHSYQAADDVLFAQLIIAYEMVSDVFHTAEIIFWCDSTKRNNEHFDELRRVMKLLLNHYLSIKGNVANFGHIALCYRVMDILSANFLVQTVDKERMSEEDRFEYRIMQINNYIRANYQQQISLKDLAEKLYLSNGYLSRFFKKNYGMNFAEYLTNIRLYHAVDEILYSDQSITRIAYDNGFINVNMFNKSFKKIYGETPSEMRKKAKNQKMIQESTVSIEAEKRLEQYLQRNGQALDKQENTGMIEAEHSVKDSKLIQPVWNMMINGGSAVDMLRSEVQEHIVLLKEALHFKYVRFWNIFLKSMFIDVTLPNEEYNFSQLDAILDFLLCQGLKPIIEFGQKPKRIQRNVQEYVLFDGERVKFKDLEHWNRVAEATFRHIANKYGREEMDSWMIEVWYDATYADNMPQQYDYFELFHNIYQLLRKYSSHIMIGGCGFQGDYNEKLDIGFLRKWKQQKYTPDFISYMYYAYERGEIHQDIYSKRSADNDSLLHNVLKMRKIVKDAGFDHIPFFVTEWNMTVSDRNFLNDSCFKGAHMVKNILDIYDKVDMIGYFLGSDRAAEYHDTGSLLFGGTGLVSKDGIFKPVGFAIDFLNRLYAYVVAKGSNYLITTDRHDNYGVICHNQKKLNYNYFFIRENEVEKDQLWKYYENRDPLELQMHLTELKDGAYKVKSYRINEHFGSVMNLWKEMDFERELSRNDIKYFRRVCEPKLEIKKIQVTGGRFDFSLKMEANEIVYIRISRII